MPTINDPFQSFNSEHESHSGHPALVVPEERKVYFACGAWHDIVTHSEVGGMGQGCFIMCETESFQFDAVLGRARRIVRYWSISLDRAVEAFDSFKSQLELRGPTGDEDVALQHLKDLKAAVRDVQKRLQQAQMELNHIDPNYVDPRFEVRHVEANRDRNVKQDAFRNQVKKIRI